MSEAFPQTPDEPRSSAQADLGGGMYTYYRDGGFAGPDKKPRGRATPARSPRRSRVPVGPIRGDSEADTGPPHYYEAPEPPATSEEAQRDLEGIAAARRILEQSTPPSDQPRPLDQSGEKQ